MALSDDISHEECLGALLFSTRSSVCCTIIMRNKGSVYYLVLKHKLESLSTCKPTGYLKRLCFFGSLSFILSIFLFFSVGSFRVYDTNIIQIPEILLSFSDKAIEY